MDKRDDTSGIFQESELLDSENTSNFSEEIDLDKKSAKDVEWFSLHKIRVLSIYCCAGISAAVVFVCIWHLLMPHGWRWLTPEELSDLKSFSISVIAGVGVSIVISFFENK